MDEKRVWVFFYGTFMDPAVLTANGIRSPDAEYLAQMVAAAKAINLPDSYVSLIESFGR